MPHPAPPPRNRIGQFSGLERRILLSCLVDADHGDTARHYSQEPLVVGIEPRWQERLEALNRYVARLAETAAGRWALRSEIFDACGSADASHPIQACDAPVGSGKTTAVMAYLLNAAVKLRLRRIFVVLPYTNIVNQAVNVYRTALTLHGEDKEAVVAAHHHQAEFGTPDYRYLTTLWQAPIVVTTAVQFFETLSANSTVRLRKLHRVPGAAVFIDEAHAAIPVHLWPFMWTRLEELGREWRCRFVLGSGSLAKFWESPRIMKEGGGPKHIPNLINETIRSTGMEQERRRIAYRTNSTPLALQDLCDWIQLWPGSRLVVMNTVQSAAVVARELRTRKADVLHLSTALAPAHREPIIEEIHKRLKHQSGGRNWTLVATSTVEAGVDFSFQVAFRERCRAASLVQIGGRVNRHGEFGGGEVWDFIVNDPSLPPHPDFATTREVVDLLFQTGRWNEDTTALMTAALVEEFKRAGGDKRIKELLEKEKSGDYPEVTRLSRVISADTRVVVVNPCLVKALRSGRPVDRRRVMAQSVQLWSRKIKALKLQPISSKDDLYAWDLAYDAGFLGVMEGLLTHIDIDRDGFAII